MFKTLLNNITSFLVWFLDTIASSPFLHIQGLMGAFVMMHGVWVLCRGITQWDTFVVVAHILSAFIVYTVMFFVVWHVFFPNKVSPWEQVFGEDV